MVEKKMKSEREDVKGGRERERKQNGEEKEEKVEEWLNEFMKKQRLVNK